jgi:hypothetical protein
MRLFLFTLVAGCAVSPVVFEEESRLLMGGPSLEQGSSMTQGGSAVDPSGVDGHSQTAQDEPDSPSVFLPDNIDFDKPVRPEEEQVVEPVPYLYTEQTGLSWYAINGLAISRDGATGMLGMSGGNSCEYNPDGAYLSGADFTNQSCPDVPVGYDDQGRVMFLCDDDLGFWSPAWGDQHYVVPGLLAAKVTAEGFVTIEDADVCQVSRHDHDGGVVSVEVPSILCATTPWMDVDETNDIVYLANGDVYAVIDNGYRLLASDAGDMVAAAEAHKAAVVAWEGETTIGAVDSAGRLLWSTEADGVIHDLESVGDRGAVFALVYEDLSLPGSFVAFDGAQGEIWGDGIAWNGLLDFSITRDASQMIVSANGGVYTYDIVIEDIIEEE